ncbi:hypothetical protein P879_06396 [Paragonimus westermani]|uniref:Uncharacterized protein n=1 Tax=Paragonimus westermani TaxID=34504 RepID=A0A8T0D1D9_9TREM|nr:hypothetical protein P879_06396 [Paragonimus westermani]
MIAIAQVRWPRSHQTAVCTGFVDSWFIAPKPARK